MLIEISIYWFTQCINAVMHFDREDRLEPASFKAGERIEPPLGFVVNPKEKHVLPPRSWGERVFNVARWTEFPRGGHFVAQEVPEDFAADIRAFFRPLRQKTAGTDAAMVGPPSTAT